MPLACISHQNEVTSCKAGVRAYELLTRYFHLIAEGNLNGAGGTTSTGNSISVVYHPSILRLQLSRHI